MTTRAAVYLENCFSSARLFVRTRVVSITAPASSITAISLNLSPRSQPTYILLTFFMAVLLAPTGASWSEVLNGAPTPREGGLLIPSALGRRCRPGHALGTVPKDGLEALEPPLPPSA